MPWSQDLFRVLYISYKNDYSVTMTIQMIYASTSGNTQLVIKYLEHFLSSGSIEVQVTEVSQLEVTGLSGDIWIFACGTYGHGLLQKDMKHLLED